MHQFPKGPEDLLLPPVEQGEAPTVQSFHGKVLRHSFRAFIAKSSVEQGKVPTAEVTSCELRKKVGIYLCVYIHVNIIVKVEYSSRERSGLGATMAHQLKVERSKSCGQLFPLSKGFYRNLLSMCFFYMCFLHVFFLQSERASE